MVRKLTKRLDKGDLPVVEYTFSPMEVWAYESEQLPGYYFTGRTQQEARASAEGGVFRRTKHSPIKRKIIFTDA